MQHKPHSFLSPSTKPTGNKRFAIDLLSGRNAALHWSGDAEPRTLPDLKCAGRLDADSTGLMLWSTDSALVERVIGSQSSVEKECTLPCTRCLERAPTPALLLMSYECPQTLGHVSFPMSDLANVICDRPQLSAMCS